MALAHIPTGIFRSIRKVCNNFLWKKYDHVQSFYWTAWDRITFPKSWGGWGIEHLPFFANALAAKGLWRILKIKNLWTNIIIHKYISPYSIKDWFRMRHKSYRNILTMWRAALNAFDLVADGFIWQIGDGKSMRLGIDPWIGCNEEFRLQDHIVEVIQNRGFCFWPAFRI